MDGSSGKDGSLNWVQLALLGLGFTTGTGFFLGSSIAIEFSGFSVLLLFAVAALGTYFVFDCLARMIAQERLPGSFRSYSKKAFGRGAGFAHGWIYWSSEMLILGSQLISLGLFTRFWFPQLQLWMLAGGYAILGVLIVLLGTKGFEKTENILAVVKLSAVGLFIVLAFMVFGGLLGTDIAHMHIPRGTHEFFTRGPLGLWTALVYVFFAFAGIEVMGIMAVQLRNPKDTPKSGRVMVPVLSVLFLLSLGAALLLAPLEAFSEEESPFVTALKDIRFTAVVHLFNGILIAAGFSGLVASLFSVTQMIYMIAKEGDAPRFFHAKSKNGIPYRALLLTVGGMIVSIIAALLLPKSVYGYVITSGGLMLLYTWLMIVLSARKLLRMSVWGHIKSITAIVLILAAVTGTLADRSSRPGFYASLAFLTIISVVTLAMRRKWKRKSEGGRLSKEMEIPDLFIPVKAALRLGIRNKARNR